jgi:hypothetical protein
MRNATLSAIGIMVVSSWGCLGDPQPGLSAEQPVTESNAVVEGTPEALGLLGFLNAAETSFELLDDDVPLERRAAENLIAHRDGLDGVFGTTDDDLFDDVAEVDGVKYVGPATLDLLITYATAQGYVPQGADVLGVYDGVAFTVDEAETTLALANTATAAELDDDVGLDSRAVDSIVEARKIVSMPVLAELYFVGQSALLKLRDYPKTLGGTKGIWEECAAHGECASGLCAGLVAYGSGWCFEAWQADTFTSETEVAVPDDGSLVTSEIEVAGMATVPLDVIVTLDIDHPRPQDLLVALHQPGGAYAVLWDHETSPPSVIEQPSGLEGDNMVNGTWTLDVIDTVTGEKGTVNGWSMWISSNFD